MLAQEGNLQTVKNFFCDMNRSSVHQRSITHRHRPITVCLINCKNWNWMVRTEWLGIRRAGGSGRIKCHSKGIQFLNIKFSFKFIAIWRLRIDSISKCAVGIQFRVAHSVHAQKSRASPLAGLLQLRYLDELVNSNAMQGAKNSAVLDC